MARFKFDQIAFNSTDKKKPVDEDKEYYIGLEHLDSGSLKVTRWGSEVAPKGEKLLMKKGDVLFGKRRAYQKKVAIAPFDGIFSAHGLVLRPKTDVIDTSFFPLFIASDYFLDAAIKISVGSLSPTINWRDLKELEFDLPSISVQQKLAKVLWAINDTKGAYQQLIQETDELVKSQFIEMMNSSTANAEKVDLGEISEMVTVGIANSATQAYAESGVPMLRNLNIQENELDDKDLVFITKEFAERYKSKALRANDILIARTGYPGRACLVPPKYEGCQTFTTLIVRLKKANEIKPEFICHYINSPYGKNFVDSMKAGSSQQNFGATALAKMPVLLPPATLQERFINIWNQSDKSKFELQYVKRNVKEMITCSQKKIQLNR